MDLVKNGQNIQNVVETSTEDFTGAFSSEDDDIEMSEEDEDEGQSIDGEEESTYPTESDASVESVHGSAFSMRNKQRFFLSMFMFVFIFIGPSRFLFGADSQGKCIHYV